MMVVRIRRRFRRRFTAFFRVRQDYAADLTVVTGVAEDSLPHLLRNCADAPRAIGLPWPNPAASNEKPASLHWLARPSSKFSKPTGSARPMRFMHTSPANSMLPGRHSSATCPAQRPGTCMTSMPPAMGSICPSVKGWSMATDSNRSSKTACT